MTNGASVTMASGKTLRVDAERRRLSLLCAAETVFRRDGLDAPLDAVAKEAGVGIATLYRRFPSRDSLIEGVFEVKMADYAQRAEAAVERADREPWPAFVDYVRDISAMQSGDPAFGMVLIRPMRGSPIFSDAHSRAMRATRRLVQRGLRAGALRADFRETDLYLLVVSVAAVTAESGPVNPSTAADRLTALFLDAARGPNA